MSEFKRSPSKVWWASESVEWREVSASPGSQDSGFSDTETSPQNQLNQAKNGETPKKIVDKQRVPKDIFKQLSSDEKPQNLSINYKEKITPNKCIKSQINSDKCNKTTLIHGATQMEIIKPNTEPARKNRYTKNSPKVSRNLFNIRQKEFTKDVIDGRLHQYSKDNVQETTHSNNSSENTFNESHSCAYEDSFVILKSSKTLPLFANKSKKSVVLNKSAPAVLENIADNEEDISFNGNNSLSSDCESELECLFNNGPLDSPKHTSTPKSGFFSKMRNQKMKMCLQYQHERVPPMHAEDIIENGAVLKWIEETKQNYEQECMTTLQCKSIAGELNQKVSYMAAFTTTNIRSILSHSQCIEREYKNLNSEKKHVGPLAQSLAGNIMDFLKTYSATEVIPKITKQYDDIRKATPENALHLLCQLFDKWQLIHHEILVKEIKKLVDKLENPHSELDLRATATGITSLALRNDNLIGIFISSDIIPILLILCEKCEGSSMRGLLLRALSTMCCNTTAVRQFEKYSGIQIIADTASEDSRPEPERSEAVALLAQVTAPWIEDNHSIRGLQEYSRKLVKSLTKFAASTKCCQNLLLCAAALANLSTMDSKCIKYMLHMNTIQFLLEAVDKRGPRASVYLLEQVATLIANMSALEAARKQLTLIQAPAALLCFLRSSSMIGDDVEKRLQQKSIIALSRLCGEKDAAFQVVQLGGIEKLVKMCREKNERYDSDAVLVATLATLRKISDSCGSEVINTQDVQELVEPKLLDSFLAYSTQNESYV